MPMRVVRQTVALIIPLLISSLPLATQAQQGGLITDVTGDGTVNVVTPRD
jgi:hypothetical protein